MEVSSTIKEGIDDEKIIIQRAYRDLLKSFKIALDDEDKKGIRQAYELAVEAHSKQRRKSGEPYILHPIAVAKICVEEIGLGPTAIIAALLHDVVEDTEVTLEDIKTQFGEKIAKLVDGLTKLDKTYETDVPQAENFKKVLSTLVEDVRVVLIKMADRLHNMRTLGSMPKHKQLKIAAETTFIYAPLAHRLGLYSIKTEFQDLCMKITEPEKYKEIAKKLQETKRDRASYIDKFIEPLQEELKELNVPFTILGRPKSIYSIYNKLKSKKIPFEEIYDLFAIRIILDVPQKKEKSYCWQVYSIVSDVYKPIPERLKDWITTAKSNGYESLHTTVIGPKGKYVEVQIRTQRMDEIAERGFAAHWKYKGITNQQDVYENWLDNIRELLDDGDKDALEFMTDFKSNLFHEEVYVYTPKGDMKVLPKGATALDFAFSIHSDLGYHCTAIKINNKLVPMGYKLENGDQIQIIVNKNQRPTESWLKMVITSKAKTKIRASLKEDNKKKGEFGKEALERKFSNLKIDFDSNIDILVKAYGYKSRPDLYYGVAIDDVNLQDFTKRFKVENGKIIPLQEAKEIIKPTVLAPTINKKSTSPILLNDEPADQYEYTFATCCNPVPGDMIFAFLSTGSGVKVHRAGCPNASNLFANYGYRVMRATWVKDVQSNFVAHILVHGIDTGVGVIEKLSNKISTALGLNIKAFSIEGKEGFFEGKMAIIVQNADQVAAAIEALEQIDGIDSVSRID
ncbi:MAG: bifunctional (p)ppGpp synthetase/guanosine-3',5'-bis(diphosphate) 3'-pyrophosphohydrolase [Saprospiraceae bacterium]|jgi:GTP pyrophosphokinase|nr:bifunctional (p)ppGpp synthetase/guanosine-3',5'-bis(diphosphate) 3'-pyrophosphohydrolase [Saprospiraceae bacterium]